MLITNNQKVISKDRSKEIKITHVDYFKQTCTWTVYTFGYYP